MRINSDYQGFWICRCTSRDDLAKIRGKPSASHAAMSSLAIGHPLSAASMLEAVAEAVRPAAERQLGAMAAVLDGSRRIEPPGSELDGGWPSHRASTSGGNGNGPTTGLGIDGGASSSSGGNGPRRLEPWNWAYAQQLLIDDACPLVSAGNLPVLSLRSGVKVI